MVRLSKHKLPKQSNKKIGRSAKHKKGAKAMARKAAKEEKANSMEEEMEPVPILTAEEKAAAKAERKKANRHNVMWKKQPGLVNTTARNGPRNVSG